MRSSEKIPVDQLVQKLKLLVFFHLGSDAKFTVNLKNGLVVSIVHPRIEPFDLEISSERLTDMADSPEEVEEIFLDLLVKNRRG